VTAHEPYVAAGTVTQYLPKGPPANGTALPAGGPQQLPVGIELDGRRGQERLVALFSNEPLTEARAHLALRSALVLARAQGRGIPELGELALPEVNQVSVWFEKP